MLNAIILIGGKSERMGFDKYRLNIHDKPQYIHLYEMLSTNDTTPWISCNNYQFPQIPNHYRKIIDDIEGIGPIGGLATAINKDPNTPILLIACDLINLTEKSIQQLVAENEIAYDIVTYHQKGSGFRETTITIYNPSSFEQVREAVSKGAYSLVGIQGKCSVKTIEIEDNAVLKNANTLKDL